VGHEVDVTIADHVADFRALTPSEAGERCVPDAAELRAVLERCGGRLARGLRGRVERRRLQLDRLGDRLTRGIDGHLCDFRVVLEGLAERASRGIRSDLDRYANGLAQAAAKLQALSPLGVLARGYSLTLKEDGRTVVRGANDIKPGDLIQTRLGQGTIFSRVL
jgi:exodeoxyribonuclease VII large subunit